MDREYLEDYEQKENEEYERLEKRIKEGKFDFEKDKIPPDQRFIKLQRPVALASYQSATLRNLWAQVPFCGSLIVFLAPIPSQDLFESLFFKTSEIPKLIDFIKETGRLQMALSAPPVDYEGMDFLDPFFKELNPPNYHTLPFSVLGNEKEVKNAEITFLTLAKVRYIDHLAKFASQGGARLAWNALRSSKQFYTILKLGRYSVVEDIENLIVDNPELAASLLTICARFIARPVVDLRADLNNFTLEETRELNRLPIVHQPQEIRLPYEIGKFLLRKLTYAAQDMRACNELIDSYAAYDLEKVQESLNEAIVKNHPDIINVNAEDLSEILDNVWNDPLIPRQTKNIIKGIPISIAAIGTAVSAFTGGIEGFLAGLGFSVGAKFLEANIEGLSERIAKFFARSYQANVYDFKKKYKDRIVKERHEKAK